MTPEHRGRAWVVEPRSMAVCPNCGEENPDRFRLCGFCGTPLHEALQPEAEERKVVSVLFVDLVGFTARSHDADPEDVRAALGPYYRRLKTEIERFGGRVEKFIGDAVVGVFGAPVAHEDDAERAVRAALQITESIAESNEASAGLDLSMRAAVNTGEVVVSLDPRMDPGQGVIGDVVNTAARLQGVAPVNGVLVGEVTHRLTEHSIRYQALDPVSVKGKPGAVPVWRALSPRSRFGVDVETRYKTPFIGRELELATLKKAYQRTLRESSLQLLTIMGEPGVGKSRLLAEFASYVDEQDEIVSWRQGRCLPYGDGITFWALGEIVKAQAGINESDSPDVAAEKLGTSVDSVVPDDDDQAWIKARLAPLVGASSTGGGGAEKEESFTAWLRFLEGIAARNPFVVVFEDLHWADESLLEFIEHVVEWSTDVSILAICTARPELFEKHSSWGVGTRNAATISLSPLADYEIAQLISGLLSQAVLPAEVHAAVLERAGGNPLYAEEFIRMLSDQGLLQQKRRTLALDPKINVSIPDNVQALIAARLDTLAPERKSLLHDAAVVGKVFWSGAVAAIGEVDDGVVKEQLDELVRKELVRPARVSSIEGEQEYSFWHALVKDVSYSQIPRRARGHKHRAMAEWVVSMAGDRLGDHAEVLAHHYREALTLAKAARADRDAAELVGPTRQFLTMAGDRASKLDVGSALDYYRSALALFAPGEQGAGAALLGAAHACQDIGLLDEAEAFLRQAVESFHRLGDVLQEGEALLDLGETLSDEGRIEEAVAFAADAHALLEQHEPSHQLTRAYCVLAGTRILQGGSLDEGLSWANKGLALARELDAPDLEAVALDMRGYARCDLGDMGGLEDLKSAAYQSDQANNSSAWIRYLNLGDWVWLEDGPAAGLEVKERSRELALSRGMAHAAMWAQAENLWMSYELGEWTQLLVDAEEVLAWATSHKADQVAIRVLPFQVAVLTQRGVLDVAEESEQRLYPLLGHNVDVWAQGLALAAAATLRMSRGDTSAAVHLVGQLAQRSEGRSGLRARFLPDVVRVLTAAGRLELAEAQSVDESAVAATRDRNSALTAKAILLQAQGALADAAVLFEGAAQRWADYGFVLEEGHAHLGLARCLIALGDRAAATEPLHKARATFSRLGAIPLLEETDGHLQRAQAAS
jgi:class 3 adenylate cyclase/tetratricopeptide (TPR) repeat protein